MQLVELMVLDLQDLAHPLTRKPHLLHLNLHHTHHRLTLLVRRRPPPLVAHLLLRLRLHLSALASP